MTTGPTVKGVVIRNSASSKLSYWSWPYCIDAIPGSVNQYRVWIVNFPVEVSTKPFKVS